MPYQDKVGQVAGGEFGSVFQAPSGGEVVPNVAGSVLQAAQYAGEAAASAAAAQTAEDNAETAETNAETAETNAEAAQAAAAASAAAAAASAAAALVSENNAETAETNAELAETNAESARDIAIAARDAALVAETNAELAETNAELAEANAEAAQAAAEAALDTFTDLYLGSKVADPTLDNDGNALQTGALYYNSVTFFLKIYNGSAWDNAASAGIGVSSIAGTANQIAASGATGDVVLSFPVNVITPTPVTGVGLTVNGIPGNVASLLVKSAGGCAIYMESTHADAAARTYGFGNGVSAHGDFFFNQSNAKGGNPITDGTTIWQVSATRNMVIGKPSSGRTLTINGVSNAAVFAINSESAQTAYHAYSVNATDKAYMGSVGVAASLISDSAVGDFAARVEGGAFRVSINSGTSTSFAVSSGGIVQTRSVLQVGGLDSGVGKVYLSTAGAANTGYVEFLNEGATRQSYIGFQTDGGYLNYVVETGGGHEFSGAAVLANCAYRATTPGYNTGITGVTNLSGRYQIPTATVVNSFSLTAHSSMYTLLDATGYIQHLAWGAIRRAGGSWDGGFFIGLSNASDSNCTEYFSFYAGGGIDHSSATMNTTSGWTFGNTKHVAISGSDCGVSFTNVSAYLLSNSTYATYSPLVVYGSKAGYSGFYLQYSAINIMYDSGGSGGIYDGGWHYYWNSTDNCLGVDGSATSSSYSLYVTGAIYSTADIVAFSDRRFKHNLVKIDSALDKVGALTGYSYDWIEGEHKRNDRRQAGLIAQDVQMVLPEAVVDDKQNDKLGLNYNAVVALLVNAVNELRAEVEELKRR
jgi:hypothetical protein